MVAQKLAYAKFNATWPLQHDVINVPELLSAVNTGSRYQMSLNSISEELTRIGARKMSRVNVGDGSKMTVWIIRDFEKYENMTHREITDLIRKKVIGAERDYYNGMNI
jgi:hypothetical protein